MESPIRIELLAAVAALLLVTIGPPAHANEAGASLVVTRGEGAEDCPGTDELVARVAAIAGGDIVSAAGAKPGSTWINVELVRVLTGYRAVISAGGERKGTRTIEDVGPGCRSLSDAVAIALVMLLDPGVSLEPKPELPAPRAEVPPQSQREPARSEATVPARVAARVEPPPASQEAVVFAAEVSGGATIAVLDHAVPLIEGGARVRLGERWSFGAGAGYVFPDRILEAPGAVKLELIFGYARACVSIFDHRDNRFQICAEPMAGSLRGEGDGYTWSTPQTLLWTAAATTAELHTLLTGPLLWSARVRVLVPVVRQGFSVEIAERPSRAFTSPPLGGTLSLGVTAEL